MGSVALQKAEADPRSPCPCCLIQTEQLGSNSEPDLHSVFEEGGQGWDGILSSQLREKTGTQRHALTGHPDVTGCQGRCL